MYVERYKNPVYMEVAGRFVEHARAKGFSPAALANAWVISHPGVTSAIVGARNLDQLNEALGCCDIRLTPEQRAEITALSVGPPLATDREPLEVAVDILARKGPP
jgi:aryl-alcohol dehydrogenase-like predicted oxidoreductase